MKKAAARAWGLKLEQGRGYSSARASVRPGLNLPVWSVRICKWLMVMIMMKTQTTMMKMTMLMMMMMMMNMMTKMMTRGGW